MRIVAFITQPRAIDRILTHLRRIATEPRARARRRGAGSLPSPPPPRKPWATTSRSLGSGAAGVRACRLVALALPDPGRATGSRPLIHPGSDWKQRVDHPIRFPGRSTQASLL